MLPIIMHLIRALRRALSKSGRAMSLTAEAFHEAMDNWRKAARKHPFAE